MAVGQVNGVFIYNGQPLNGATAKLWDREVFYTTADSGEEISDNPLTAAAATLNCSDGTQFAAGDLIEVETEHMLVISINVDELTVQRGYDNTTPAEHVQTTAIYDLTQDDPEQDDAEPGSGQQGATITTAIAYGGDGAYRWTDVPDGEYFVSVYYDNHRAWLHVAVEGRNTLSQILKLAGDLPYRGTNAIERLPKGSDGEYLTLASGLPAWASVSAVVSGLIVMWHGTIGTIPAGFVICDGNNSTPNLLAKFVEGVATAGTDPGAGGGAISKRLATTGGAAGSTGPAIVAKDSDGVMKNYTAGTDYLQLTSIISDVRPPYYDVAFLMKT